MTVKLTLEQLDELKKAFRTFDEDGDGQVTICELRNVFTTPLGLILFTDEEIQNMISQVDIDNTASLNFEEFVNWILNN